MFSTMIKSPAIVILCLCLAFVHWLGATVYSANIEHDIATRTQQEIDTHRVEVPDILRAVDGRDVSLYGSASNELARITAGEETRSVWGVRVLDNHISVEDADVAPLIVPVPEPDMSVPFSLHAQHDYPDLRITGQVDKPAYELIVGVHQALPPDSSIDYDSLRFDAKELQRSARIVETGIAAVTQLNPGRLTITGAQFILEGTVLSEDRRKTVEQLIDVRRSEIEPLEIIVNISVESPGITALCRDSIERILAHNVLNYSVDHYKILDNHLSVLKPIADTVLGVCEGQIEKILVEGHADYTGGANYNQGLSERRSGAARDNLIENGVDAQLISAFGYGEFRPIASNETVEGRAMNRRTEIYLSMQDSSPGEQVPVSSLIEE